MVFIDNVYVYIFQISVEMNFSPAADYIKKKKNGESNWGAYL